MEAQCELGESESDCHSRSISLVHLAGALLSLQQFASRSTNEQLLYAWLSSNDMASRIIAQ